MGVTFKLIKKIGTVGQTPKGEKKLQFVSWNGEEPVYDLRLWMTGNKASSGVTFSKEDLLRIVEIYKGIEPTKEEVEEENTEQSIDDIFPINEPEEEEESAEEPKLVQMPGTDIPQEEGRERGRKQSINAKKPKSNSKIVKMPEPIEKAKTTGNATYEDACNKLDELFGDMAQASNFGYVLTGLKELAAVDDEFVQNVMRESRTFEGMMNYAGNEARKIGTSFNGGALLVDDQMLATCINYFSAKEEEKKVAKNTTSTSTKKKVGRPKTKSVKEENIDDLLNFN